MNLADTTATADPEMSGRGAVVAPRPVHDPESAEWIRSLCGTIEAKANAEERLHGLMLRIARREVHRRSGQLQVGAAELDDLAHQAAADALVAVTAKIETFRGESRFTTWAYKFVIFEVSTKIGRHFWRRPSIAMEGEDWERLPDRLGCDPARESEWRELLSALHRAVDEVLTERQRQIFIAIVLNGIPLDALVASTGSKRNAIYKTLFDARRKLRAELGANGYLDVETARPS